MFLKKFIHAIIFIHVGLLGQSQSQPSILFDTDLVDAENHWVVLPLKENNDSYLFGYLHLDAYMGFVFTLEGFVTLEPNKMWKQIGDKTIPIVRKKATGSCAKVCLLSLQNRETLNLPVKPNWLLVYDEEPTLEILILKGKRYNKMKRSHLAIPYLEKAYHQDSSFKNLNFELSFAYNATRQFEKAIAILREAIPLDAANVLLYSELGYSFLKTGQFDAAEEVYYGGIKACSDPYQIRDMLIDITRNFYNLKDASRFEKWAALLKNY